MQTPLWHIEMLGQYRLVRGDQIITQFRTTKSALLLARLACFPRQAHVREQLSDLFWPDADLPTGRNRLKQEIANVRRVLEPPDVESGTVLYADRISVCLQKEAFTTDVGEFERLAQARHTGNLTMPNEPRRASDALEENDRAERLARSIELYAGDLLPGYYEDWVLAERERLARLYLRALRELAGYHAKAGRQEQAIELLLCAINVAPLEEEAIADLMRLLLSMGQPSEAVRKFRVWTERAKRTNLSPSRELYILATECANWAQQSAPLLLPMPLLYSTAPIIRETTIVSPEATPQAQCTQLILAAVKEHETSGQWIESRKALELALAVDEAITPEECIELHMLIGNFAHRLGDFAASRIHLEAALALCHQEQKSEATAHVFQLLGTVGLVEDDYTRANTFLRASRTGWQSLGNAVSMAFTEYLMGVLSLHKGQYTQANRSFQLAVQVAKEHNESNIVAHVAVERGVLELCCGNYEAAAAQCQQGERLFNAEGYHANVAWAQSKLALVRQAQGCNEEAKSLLEQSLAAQTPVGDRRHITYLLHDLGRLALNQGDYDVACRYLDEAFTLARQIGHRRGLALVTGTRALLALEEGDTSRACILAGESRTLRLALGNPRLIAEAQGFHTALRRR